MPKIRRPHRDHHLTYFDVKLGQYIYTTPKDWARVHQNHFPPEKTFANSDTTPTVDEIEAELKDKYGFVEFTYKKVIVLCNFNTEIKFDKGEYLR